MSSVKTDLLRASLADRSAAGEVKVFDPLGITTMDKARWSPLRAARDLKGALAAAQMLAVGGIFPLSIRPQVSALLIGDELISGVVASGDDAADGGGAAVRG